MARSRKRGRTAPHPEQVDTAGMTRAEKTEAKNEAVRRPLEPLQRGERPRWVTYAALVATALGLLNIVLYAAGVRAEGGTFEGTVGVGVILLVCAGGMWFAQYWAVLGFQVLLGITIVYGGLSLLVANTIAGAVRSTLVLVIASLFFYKLVRAMARLQMPQRPQPRP